MVVESIDTSAYHLTNDMGKVALMKDEHISLAVQDTVQVFLYTNKTGEVVASTELPTASRRMFGWGEIVEAIPNLGEFIRLHTDIEILVSIDELPEEHKLYHDTEVILFILFLMV